MFLLLSVCLSVCLSARLVDERILMNFFWRSGRGPRNNHSFIHSFIHSFYFVRGMTERKPIDNKLYTNKTKRMKTNSSFFV